MGDFRDIELSGSTIRNGRIYFDVADQSFFPMDSFGDRTRLKGKGGTVTFIAGADSHQTDIRMISGVRIGPRKSFARYFEAIKAVEGGKLRVVRVAERTYKFELLFL